MQQPSKVDALLREVVRERGALPADAYEIGDLGEVPASLRRIVQIAAHFGRSCSCWKDDRNRHFLFVGEMSLELSRERGVPVLQVDQYGEDGLMSSTKWVADHQGKWQRCGE